MYTKPQDFITDKSTTLCFTGHRERSIPVYQGDEKYRQLTYNTVEFLLSRYIDSAVERGYRTFISGFAEGFDLWAAEYVLKLKQKGAAVRLVGAIPFHRHADRFSYENKQLLSRVTQNAEMLISVCGDPNMRYSPKPVFNFQSNTLYKDRNYFMVDNSSALIGFCENYASGTGQTVNYARKCGLDVVTYNSAEVFEFLDKHNYNTSR